jgi:equilibrative nucleoside transporter 1/2/3
MDWVRSRLGQRQKPVDNREYEPLHDGPTAVAEENTEETRDEVPFSWLEYGLFALIGMAMLWAWYGPFRAGQDDALDKSPNH